MRRRSADEQYSKLLLKLLKSPTSGSRNASVRRVTVPSLYVFTRFPLITKRKTAWKTALREMEFFLTGSDRLEDMHPSVRPWWEAQSRDGKLPNSYGVQLRDFHGRHGSVDQIQLLLDGLRDHPNGRRHVLTTWNSADMAHPSTIITNCHGTSIQFYLMNGKLDMFMFQRSQDVMCGLPHNWAQYWALLVWVAHRSGSTPRKFTWLGGDVHLYQVHEDLARKISTGPAQSEAPNLVYSPTSEDFKADDFSLSGPYEPACDDRAELVV